MSSVTFDATYTEEEFLSRVRSDFTRRAPVYNDGVNGAMHVDLVRSLLHFHPPSYPVLDIACGTGLVIAELGRSGEGATGIDLTPGMLEVARALSPKGTFVEGRAEKLPFPDEAFGSAYICAALVYFTDVDKALREAWRVLKEGGSLAYQAVTLDSYVAGVALETALVDTLGEERGYKLFKLPHGITNTYEANVQLMEKAGFVDVTMEKVTVLSDLTVSGAEDWWDRFSTNAMTWPVHTLPEKDVNEVQKRFIELLEAQRRPDNTIQESVTSWYVKGTKPVNS